MPEPTRTAARPAGPYANTLGTEKSWKRGLAILWTLIVLTLLLEGLNAAGYVLAGRAGWPLPIEAGRIALVCTFFVSLWAGFGWLRYVLALVDLGSCVWLSFILVHSYKEAPKFWATKESEWTVYSSFETGVKIALAVLYLVTCLYVLFSDDVREFSLHRRAGGRIWSALLVTVFSYGCMVLIFAAQPIYATWMQGQRAEMQRFGDGLLQTMASRWDPATFGPVIDSEYAKTLTKEGRAATFANFRDLGPLKSANSAPMKPQPPMPQYPLQDKVALPDDLKTEPGLNGAGFVMNGTYKTTGATFEHGSVQFSFDLTRDLSGPWRLTKFNADNVQIDRPHPPAPDATPVAPGTAPSASPGIVPSPAPAVSATPSSAPTGAVAPSSPIASPAATVAPTPAATPAPAASPAPTTGG